MTDQFVLDEIKKVITENDVVLYMKGTPEMPQCGFSSMVVQILRHLHLSFRSIDVLSDPAVRVAIKTFSNWPTIPQLYIKGEFVGGCDIVKEMYQSGELKTLLQNGGVQTTVN